jgi:hypothetical protein
VLPETPGIPPVLLHGKVLFEVVFEVRPPLEKRRDLVTNSTVTCGAIPRLVDASAPITNPGMTPNSSDRGGIFSFDFPHDNPAQREGKITIFPDEIDLLISRLGILTVAEFLRTDQVFIIDAREMTQAVCARHVSLPCWGI